MDITVLLVAMLLFMLGLAMMALVGFLWYVHKIMQCRQVKKELQDLEDYVYGESPHYTPEELEEARERFESVTSGKTLFQDLAESHSTTRKGARKR